MSDYLSSYLIGLSTALHPCSFMITLSALQILFKLSLDQRQSKFTSFAFILSYACSLYFIGALVFEGLLLSHTVSRYAHHLSLLLLGPLLILTGMFYCGLIQLKFNQPFFKNISQQLSKHQNKSSFILGILLSLSFCPATALIFLGIFIPKLIDAPSPHVHILFYLLGPTSLLCFTSILFYKGSSLLKQHQTLSITLGKWSGFFLIVTGMVISIRNTFS